MHTHPTQQEFETCKEYLLQSGHFVVEKASSQKQKIVEFAQDFIQDGGVILVHSYSRVVNQLLLTAAQNNKRFKVWLQSRVLCLSGDGPYTDPIAVSFVSCRCIVGRLPSTTRGTHITL